jgi:aspartate aminotransferase
MLNEDYVGKVISGRFENIKGSKTSEIRNLANNLQQEGKAVINLAAGELTCNAAAIINSAAIDAINNQCNLYTGTEGLLPLRKKIAEKLSRQTHFKYSSEQVIVTVGAKQALFHCANILLDVGDEVLIPSPHWNTFSSQVSLVGGKPVVINCSEYDFKLTENLLREHITKRTKVLIINSPNNPTGKVYLPSEIHAFAKLAVKYDFWIILDSSYSSYQYIAEKDFLLDLPIEYQSKFIIVSSFSKEYALTGWRIGYMAAPIEIIKAAKTFQGHTTSNVNNIAQYAALATFSEAAKDFVEERKKIMIKNRSIGLEILYESKYFKPIVPEGGFYFYCNVNLEKLSALLGENFKDSEELAYYFLEHKNVMFTPGTAFNDKNGARLSFSVNREDLIEGLNRIVKI